MSRRTFLKHVALGMAGAAMPWTLQLATAAGVTGHTSSSKEDYKALVCVFLYGGNDPYNTVVPYDEESYRQYARIRPDIALPRDQLAATVLQPRVLPHASAFSTSQEFSATQVAATTRAFYIPQQTSATKRRAAIGECHDTGGRRYALASSLAPLKPLFDRGEMAVQLNVGPLVVPTMKADYISARVPLPPKLFSHNDQHSCWQGMAAEGAASGWGGRFADCFVGENGQRTFTTITAGGNALFLTGQHVSAYQVNAAGPVSVELLQRDMYGSAACTDLLRILLTQAGPHLFEQHIAATLARSIHADRQLRAALAGVTVPGNFATPLAEQLGMVARIIAARHKLGLRRQVFFVSQNGYDMHEGLTNTHPRLLGELANALVTFQQAMEQLGVAENVTTFTGSEFGRTLPANGDGSDHGWGGHHFILGAAVQGGQFYGTDPELVLTGPGFVDNGRLLPTTSVDQFGATLGAWFGIPTTTLNEIFPNLREFDVRDMGFMRRSNQACI